MHFSKTGQCLKHLNEESLSVTSFCVCVCVCLMRCKMTYVVYNFDAENCTSCLLCSEFYLWFCSELACALIHMYSCMICPYQLYHCKLILICNSICHYFTKLACGEAPKYHFLCHSLWSFSLHNNVCVCVCVCDVVYCYWTLWFLYMKDAVNLYQTHAPDPFCPPQQLTCYRSVFTHVWGQHLCRLCPQSASSFLFFIYKVDIENCCVYITVM